MKTRLTVLCVSCLTLYTVHAADGPSVNFSLAFYPSYPMFLTVNLANTNQFVLERSGNFVDWRPYLNIFTSAPSVTFGLTSIGAGQADREFYRGSDHVQSVSDTRGAWNSLGFSRYRFRGMRLCFCGPGNQLSATVTVENGKVVSVEDGRLGGFDGPPATVNVLDFKSVEQIFDQITSYMSFSNLIAIQWNDELPFPSWTFLNPATWSSDGDVTYWIKDLVQL